MFMGTSRFRSGLTVAIPARNAEGYLSEALYSLSAQTRKPDEIIVVDDGSTDETSALLEKWKFVLPQLRILTSVRPRGIANSLNRALGESSNRFIARLDADDYALPQRFGMQLSFLKANPDYVLVGSFIELVRNDKVIGKKKYPSDPLVVNNLSAVVNCFAHPAVMFDSSNPSCGNEIRYSEKYDTSQDFELWSRIVASGKCTNLPQTLTRYRLHSGSISSTKRLVQAENSATIMARNLVTFWGNKNGSNVHLERNALAFARLFYLREGNLKANEQAFAVMVMKELVGCKRFPRGFCDFMWINKVLVSVIFIPDKALKFKFRVVCLLLVFVFKWVLKFVWDRRMCIQDS
jgi:glycosyltransferase involved in cell wall biosynthesis